MTPQQPKTLITKCPKCKRTSIIVDMVNNCPFCKPKQKPVEKTEWEDEYVELYGYLDKYVKGIIGRQGKWFASILDSQTQKAVAEAKRKFQKDTEAILIGQDEVYCDWYKCKNCNDEMITSSSIFCPNCGRRVIKNYSISTIKS